MPHDFEASSSDAQDVTCNPRFCPFIMAGKSLTTRVFWEDCESQPKTQIFMRVRFFEAFSQRTARMMRFGNIGHLAGYFDKAIDVQDSVLLMTAWLRCVHAFNECCATQEPRSHGDRASPQVSSWPNLPVHLAFAGSGSFLGSPRPSSIVCGDTIWVV